jgi:hypothetical protein
MTNEFNDFFTGIGVKIAESIKPTIAKPEDCMPTLLGLQELDLGTIGKPSL